LAEALRIISKPGLYNSVSSKNGNKTAINGSTVKENFHINSDEDELLNKPVAIILLDKDEVIILMEGSGLEDLMLNKYELIGGCIHEQFKSNPLILNIISKAVQYRKRSTLFMLHSKCYEISLTYTFKNKTELTGIIIVVIESSLNNNNSNDKYEKNSSQQLFEKSPDAIAVLDSEDNIIITNQSFIQLFGYREENLEGENIYSLIQRSICALK
jgi:PAS domain-containing protein